MRRLLTILVLPLVLLPLSMSAAQDQAGQLAKQRDIAERIVEHATSSGFVGEWVVSPVEAYSRYGVTEPRISEQLAEDPATLTRWPWASITKQVLAHRLLREMELSDVGLDTPISKVLPSVADDAPVPTIRQLLQHRSGLVNPEDTPIEANGWPAFYNAPDQYGLSWCLNDRTEPQESGWRYNNCDYLVLGAVLEELSFESVDYMVGKAVGTIIDEQGSEVNTRAMITPDNVSSFFAMREPESEVLPNYGASGSLGGSLQDLMFFNATLIDEFEAGRPFMAPFWEGDPELGYMALGQWVFTVRLNGCDAPVMVAERHGEIGQYRLRNIILPELKRSMAFATIDSEFEFGQIWTGEGFLHEAVAMLACGDKE